MNTDIPSASLPSTRSLITVIVLLCIALVIGLAIGPALQQRLASLREQRMQETGTWYISQMHPWIIQPEPGFCPICGMDLTPVDPERFVGEIAIDPVVVQNFGVRVEEATRGPASQTLRSVGTVVPDPALTYDLVQRFSGWVNTVYRSDPWGRVSQQEPLFRVYAPEVLTAVDAFLRVRDSGDRPLYLAAQRRLKLLGLHPEQIEGIQLYDDGAIDVLSPADGFIWQRNVYAGSDVSANTRTFRIVDLSRVWIELALFSHQMPLVEAGQQVRIRLADGADSELQAYIDSIYPMVDERTRQGRARIIVENPAGANGPLLRPGMYAKVDIEVPMGKEALVSIPRGAVVGTGTRRVAFVSLGRGRFEPRDLVLGPILADSRVAVIAGVEEGEQVVISGQFLLDSESRMRDALVRMIRGEQVGGRMQEAGEAEQSLDSASQEIWAQLIKEYLDLQEQLYRDPKAPSPALDGLRQTTRAFAQAVGDPATAPAEAAGHLQGESLAHDFGVFSIALNDLLQQFGAPAGLAEPLTGMRCGMAPDIPDGGVWLQLGPAIRNPYFGAEHGMRACAVDIWQLPSSDTL